MEIIRKCSVTTLANSGVQSDQLLFPENSSSRRVTITMGDCATRSSQSSTSASCFRGSLLKEKGRYCSIMIGRRRSGPGTLFALTIGICTVSTTPMMRRSYICRLQPHH
jgi:hypothetical protein